MIRYALVVALLMIPMANTVWAQVSSPPYIRIKVDLNKFKPGMNPSGNQGGNPGGGEGGFPGDGGGGFPGGGGPGGGFPGGGGGSPGGGGPGGGFPGGGGPGGGFPGGGGGSPGGGKGGGPGFPGGPGGGFPGEGGNNPVEEEPPVWVEARLHVLELRQITKDHVRLDLTSRGWGKPVVPIKAIQAMPSRRDLLTRYNSKRREAQKENTAQKYFLLAQWALQRGFIKQFEINMDDLGQVEPKNPAYNAYLKTKKELEVKPQLDDPTASEIIAERKSANFQGHISETGRYNLYSKLDAKDKSVKRRLEFLDRSYQCFYYWFALNGKVIPQPNYRLVAVLESTPTDYKSRYNSFHTQALVDDSFWARRDNVIFLSAVPINDSYTTLARNNKVYWQKLGNLKPLDVLKKTARSEDEAILQTLALLQTLLEEETEYQATSHETARQLLAASGLLPHNIPTAEWLQFGIASFFEFPRNSFYPTTTLGNWTHLVNFKHYHAKKRIPNNDKGMFLLNVITDRFFQKADISLAVLSTVKEDYDEAEERALEELDISRSSAWALTYYLMNNKLDQVMDYLAELRKLPRDVEFDRMMQAKLFAKSFDLLDGQGQQAQVSMAKVNALANDWYRTVLENSFLDVDGIEGIVLAERRADENPKTGPNNPGNGGGTGPNPPGGGGRPGGVGPTPPGGGGPTPPGGGPTPPGGGPGSPSGPGRGR